MNRNKLELKVKMMIICLKANCNSFQIFLNNEKAKAIIYHIERIIAFYLLISSFAKYWHLDFTLKLLINSTCCL